jgi:hypothetical protein
MKIGHQVGLGYKVQGSQFRVNRFAFFPITIDSTCPPSRAQARRAGWVNTMRASTSEPLNREPFNPTLALETEPFVQNITLKFGIIYEISLNKLTS